MLVMIFPIAFGFLIFVALPLSFKIFKKKHNPLELSTEKKFWYIQALRGSQKD